MIFFIFHVHGFGSELKIVFFTYVLIWFIIIKILILGFKDVNHNSVSGDNCLEYDGFLLFLTI